MAHRFLAALATGVLVALLPCAASARVPVPSPTAVPSELSGTPTATPSPTCTCNRTPVVPRASAAPNPARSGEVVELDGSASSGTFNIYVWDQLSGPAVAIANIQAAITSFVAPPVASPTVLVFELILYAPGPPTEYRTTVEVTVLPPTGVAWIAVEDAGTVTGEPAPLGVRLYTDLAVARLEHDLELASSLVILATPDGHPDCTVAPELGVETAQFDFRPQGCTAGACSGVHVALAGSSPLANGALLYHCMVAAGFAPSPSCDFLVTCGAESAYDAGGQPLPARCSEGIVRSEYATPQLDILLTVEPSQPRVGDAVRITVDTAVGHGPVGRPFYRLSGAEPLLSGDTAPRSFSGPMQFTYELRAVQAGTTVLSISMFFEAHGGCPGNDVYYPSGAASEPVPLTITGGPSCAGDCDANGWVGIDELIRGVRMALGDARTPACAAMDRDGNGAVQVPDLVAAVTASLLGCVH